MKPIQVFLFPVLAVVSLAQAQAAAPPETIVLDSPALGLVVTPSFGGRVLSLARKGQENVLLVGEAAERVPEADVRVEAPYVPYFGHTVWLGPQSEWWVHQSLLPERRQRRAVWPPDPYLTQSQAKVVRRGEQNVTLELPASPVSGVQLRKSFVLPKEHPNRVEMTVEATNQRSDPVAWDIWFNTRVRASAQVYVPVASAEDVRLQDMARGDEVGLDYSLRQGLFSLAHSSPEEAAGRQGKVLLQPAAGWFAAFMGDQLLIIAFPWHSEDAIHPEQGQVEIYTQYGFGARAEGILELEVHTPYRRLQPGQAMQAQEHWYLLPYAGGSEREAQVEFLLASVKQLGLNERLSEQAYSSSGPGKLAK